MSNGLKPWYQPPSVPIYVHLLFWFWFRCNAGSFVLRGAISNDYSQISLHLGSCWLIYEFALPLGTTYSLSWTLYASKNISFRVVQSELLTKTCTLRFACFRRYSYLYIWFWKCFCGISCNSSPYHLVDQYFSGLPSKRPVTCVNHECCHP